MEQCYKDDCGSSLGFIVEKRKDIEKDQAEDDEKEPKSISLREEEEEDNDDRANSIDLEGDVEEEEEKKHMCSECGKQFMSGKALGGHKRIHVLENQNKSGESEIDCSVCHKKFTSRKALYGHMRFHPDRAWKGVLPPSPPHPLGNSSSSTLSTDDHHVGEFTSSDHDDDDDGYDNIDAKDQIDESDNIDAKDLMLLATTAEAVNLDVAETCDSHSAEDMKKKKRRLPEIEKVSSSSTHDHHHQLGDVAAAAEEGGGARKKHVCVTCNKSFTSYQALGGHRASHNKAKILENHRARANREASLLGTEAMITDHVCDICHKSFPTGQALGGHKRRHWTGPVSSEAATADPTAPAAGSSHQVTETVQEGQGEPHAESAKASEDDAKKNLWVKICVTGYDTWLPDIEICDALYGGEDKALQLNGSELSGWNLAVKVVSTTRPSTELTPKQLALIEELKYDKTFWYGIGIMSYKIMQSESDLKRHDFSSCGVITDVITPRDSQDAHC
ncbi:unnamed protein product, partial [Brassica oleracea]